MDTLLLIALIGAALPCGLTLWNLWLYQPPPPADDESSGERAGVSVLIPARNEEANIREAVLAALANEGVELEVVVLDDASEDRTAAMVRELSESDPRVRLAAAPPLPAGWCGKQHACQTLATLARHPLLVFVDADVRLHPGSLHRMAAFVERHNADLASGIPHQRTGSWMEHLLIPLIHFLLLGYLPFVGVRLTRWPMFAAGCGQLFIARRAAYERAGGHAAIRTSLHDGLTLPRAFRRAGCRTDLFDATGIATCRMYTGARQVWNGLLKNATEGVAAWGAIGPLTLLLFGGQVLPLLLLLGAGGFGAREWRLLAPALACVWLPRLIQAWRFRLSWRGASGHPLAVLLFLIIQWTARLRALRHRPAHWKGRSYPA